MRIVPVLDIANGRAVHAVGGNRIHYQPLRTILHNGCDPCGVAQAYRDQLGLADLYVADLDAITGALPDVETLSSLVNLGLRVWLDAGCRDATSLPPLRELGIHRCIAGLETVRGPRALAGLVEAVGPDRLVFSLDLHAGEPRIAAGAHWMSRTPDSIADEALNLGVRHLILLDLARVGTGQGIGTLELLSALAGKCPAVSLTVGGGIARAEEIHALKGRGASAVLIGSALHDGRIRVRDGSMLDHR